MPGFFPPQLCEQILQVGKTVDFLRRVCHVREPFMDAVAQARPLTDVPLQQGEVVVWKN